MIMWNHCIREKYLKTNRLIGPHATSSTFCFYWILITHVAPKTKLKLQEVVIKNCDDKYKG